MFKICYMVFLIYACLTGLSEAKGCHKVHCTEDLMRVEIGICDDFGISNNSELPLIYLEGLKGYPNERCHPKTNGSLVEFRLSLVDFYECGVTRMVNQLTGKKVFYHKIIIESSHSKEIISVKCITAANSVYMVNKNTSIHQQPILLKHQSHGMVRRDVLPIGFQEPDDLEITTSLTERAPEPRLSIGVNQNGEKVTGDLNVTPGTPLTMEINLDPDSASVYGLGVNFLEVTDTRLLSETIIFKGCTVDPYLFENFNTLDGDTLSAKFKAFKFPDSAYVQFRATVNVCLDKCLGTQCANGQIGYGRRRRDTFHTLNQPLMDTSKVYEISLTMFIKVNDVKGVKRNEILNLEEELRNLKLANQRLARNSRDSFVESINFSERALMFSASTYVLAENEHNQTLSGASVKTFEIYLSITLIILSYKYL